MTLNIALKTSAGLKAVPSVQLHWAPGALGRQNDGFINYLLSFYQTFLCLTIYFAQEFAKSIVNTKKFGKTFTENE